MEIKKEPLETQYEVLEDIGKGQFATVKRCIHKESQAEYAAKFIRKRRGGGRRGAKMEDIQKEIDILSTVSHRNIIRLHEVYETNREVILLLELVSGGELFEYLSEKDKLSEEEASAFIKQILDGVQHLHSKNIAHLDLKPENILLQDKNSTHVKLIDFGLSRKILPNEDHRAMMGTAEFVAPEVVSFEQLTLATDMWSIGVITYILLSGASPFLGENQQETYHNITAVNYEFDEEFFNGTSDLAKGFIRSLLVKDKRKRATIHDCLNHPWIKPVEKKQRDLRRSSIIKTEHLKKFIARQRWKRSMRVVSLCNRLSRSLQLRRMQSTDTLGSCSEEATLKVSLSAPARSESSGTDKEDEQLDVSDVGTVKVNDEGAAGTFAKNIIGDIMEEVFQKGNVPSCTTQEDLIADSLKEKVNFYDDLNNTNSDISSVFPDYSKELVSGKSLKDQPFNRNETIEIFVTEAEGVPSSATTETDNIDNLLPTSLPALRHSRSKRRSSDLQDIKEESLDVPENTTDSKDTRDANCDSEHDVSLSYLQNEILDIVFFNNDMRDKTSLSKEPLKHETTQNADLMADKESLSDSLMGDCNDKLNDLLEEDKERDDEPASHSGYSESNYNKAIPEMASGYNQDISNKKSQEIVNPDILVTCESTGFSNLEEKFEHIYDQLDNNVCLYGERDPNQWGQMVQSKIELQHSENTQEIVQVDTCNETKPDELGKKSFEGYHSDSSSLEEVASLIVSKVIEKAKLELFRERNTRHDSSSISNVNATGTSRDVYKESTASELPDLQEHGTEKDVSTEAGIHALTLLNHFDPLHIVYFHETKDFQIGRDLFDIPEEYCSDIENENMIQVPISEEVKMKILRQRLRKMSLQRKVQAKIIQETAFNEMTKFRKLRDERRIESYEMKILKYW